MADILTAKRLREDRAPLAHQIRELADLANNEKRDFSAEEQEKWDSLNKAYDEHTRAIELAERAEKVTFEQEAPADEQRPETRSGKPGRHDVDHAPAREGAEDRSLPSNEPTEEDRAFALQAWLRCGVDKEISERHRRAAAKCGISPNAKEITLNMRGDYRNVRRELRALSAQSGTAGAHTIAEGFMASLERAMLHFGGMRQTSEIMRTTGGNSMPWPTANDTSNSGALLGENTAVTDADPVYGQVVFNAYKYTSKQVKIPVELLEDSAFDMAAEVGTMLGERLGRITNTHFTTGDGASKPKGIVTAATLGKTTAGATAITFDEVIDLIHSVDVAYRTDAGFMFHDNVLAVLRKLKNGSNEYLWQPSVAMGAPDRLWGYPYYINNDMASSVASAAKTMLFGALNKYKIRDVAGLRLVRLNERYADADQVGFIAFSRHDGNLLDAGVAPVKYMQQV